MSTIELADRLAALLNEGSGQCDALAELGIDEDDVMSEHSCLPLDDPDNHVIDLCNGAYVQRHGGTWQVHTYTN